ncbi:hypothetical protein [Mycobacterium arosiense]|uniref:Uncharacterized protein n=1 Tax=Mycobacterium arosiense ATCC BAA-1401 = DSM 45069 TaxID=1265311 RepID=A0A1W9Z9L1_MYCAI|nr:hypothetical protein [Mycobacterium arosiense]ORA09922.1 hypothetical protein BST14_21110 [Mycobacterium arosiense ATCC BAA-1401 = DSM 45069]
MKIRAIELVRAGWGAVLLVAPAEVLNHLHGVQVDRKALVVTRILGARHLAQSLLSGVNPGPEVLAAGVWVDAVHSATALGLAVIDRRRARGGVTDAVVAASWAALGWRHLRAGRARTDGVRGRDRLARAVVGALPGGRGLMARAQAVRAG